MNIIEINDIKKSYGRKVILKGITFSVKKGECVALVGANGCGKSTLLGIMAGAVRPDGGKITYGGEEPFKDKKLFNKYTGYVPQENPLLSKLSVYDNLRFWYCDSGRDLEQDMKDGVLHEFGLDVYRNYQVSKLSGGMKKRLSIACALAANPPILIMDEPGAALDIVCKEDIKRYLKGYLANGGTVVITSHEESELAICDRMLLLKDGMVSELSNVPTGEELLKYLK